MTGDHPAAAAVVAVVVVEIATGPGTATPSLPATTLAALRLGATLGPVTAVVAGPLPSEARVTLESYGVRDAVVVCPHTDVGGHVDPALVTDALEQLVLVEPAVVVVAAPSVTAREAFGRLAVRRGAPVVTGVTGVRRDGTETVVTTVADGGRRTGRARTGSSAVLLLTDPSAADTGAPADAGADERGRHVDHDLQIRTADGDVARTAVTVEVLASVPRAGLGEVSLTEAAVVVVAGRGLGSAAAVDELRSWAARIGAAFGSARGPVEAGWAPFDRLVGQTGTTIAPDLYLAFGVSGAPQHMAGMRGSRTVVAVNSDPTAPILDESDVAVVADARTVLQLLAAGT